jgi:hypothetical protein
LANVYLTDTTDTSSSGALNDGHIFGHMSDIAPGTNTTFYVAMADLDSDTDTYIAQDARLIINVPSGFGNVTVTSWNKFVTEPTITLRADGITQIIGQTNEAIGNSGQEAAVIAFLPRSLLRRAKTRST